MNEKFLRLKSDKEFEMFYKTNFPKVVSHIDHKMGNYVAAKNIAEDVAQEVFYVAMAKWDEVKVNEQPLRWLFQTANYKILETNRKLSSHPVEYLEDNMQEPPAEEADYGMTELEASALKTVDENEWDLVKKYYSQGYPIDDLAEAEGITPNNMRVRLSRMRSKLRDALSG